MKVRLLIMLAIAVAFIGCQHKKAGENNTHQTILADNLLYSAKWKAVTDQLGSSYAPQQVEVVDSALEVRFTLKQQVEKEIVFIELVCGLKSNLKSSAGLKIKYRCDTPLVIKLSQSDFGADGDNSYAHYQYVVPASKEYTNTLVKFKDFTQPTWTPEPSKKIAINLEHVKAVYLTPNVDATIGGSALLGVKELILQ